MEVKWWQYLIDKLLPNGAGIKGALALIVVYLTLPEIPPEDKSKIILMVITAYFTIKAMNGSGK